MIDPKKTLVMKPCGQYFIKIHIYCFNVLTSYKYLVIYLVFMLNINKQKTKQISKTAGKSLQTMNPYQKCTLRGWNDLILNHHALKVNCSQMWMCKEAIKTKWRRIVHSELGKSNGSTEHFGKVSSLCNKDQGLDLKLQGNFKAIPGERGQKTW